MLHLLSGVFGGCGLLHSVISQVPMLVLQNFGHLCVLTTGIFPCRFDGDPNLDIVQPAIRGTRTVLEAAAKQKQHGLKRVVVTSSVCGEANLIVLFMLIFQQCILFASWSLHGQWAVYCRKHCDPQLLDTAEELLWFLSTPAPDGTGRVQQSMT
jgi:hypothetical protein